MIHHYQRPRGCRRDLWQLALLFDRQLMESDHSRSNKRTKKTQYVLQCINVIHLKDVNYVALQKNKVAVILQWASIAHIKYRVGDLQLVVKRSPVH